MTCQELHSRFENPLLADASLLADCGEIAEHLADCAECCSFVEQQRELGNELRLVRESVPPVPPSLDDAVLADYRSLLVRQANSTCPTRTRKRPSMLVALGWTAAVAAALIVAGVEANLFFSGEDTVSRVTPSQRVPSRSQVVVSPTVPSGSVFESHAPKSVSGVPRRAAGVGTSARRLAPRERAENANLGVPFPAGFRSLMYCDELSCGGALDMIRVQLPASFPGLTPGSGQPNGVVSADILVGSDGIARGIRIVE